jgi:hypothetical protein
MKQTKTFSIIIGFCIFLIVIACVIGAYSKSEQFVGTVPFDPSSNPVNVAIVDALSKIIDRYNVTTIADMGCGDCEWVPLLLEKYPIVTYVGYEKSPELVQKATTTLSKYKNASLKQEDPTTVTAVTTDLVISRNLLSTLPYSRIRTTIANFSKFDCKYFALGQYDYKSSKNVDIAPGESFMIDLEKVPFNMSPAFIVIEENTNRIMYIFTIEQMQGFILGNAFFK